MTTENQIAAMQRILKVIVDTIKSESMGCPSGILYAGLQAHGCTFSQYEAIISALKRTGRIRQDGDLLFSIN